MIYIAAIYVSICAIQLAFTIWRDLKETKRRSSTQELTRIYSEKAADNDARMTIAIEGFRKELFAIKKAKP